MIGVKTHSLKQIKSLWEATRFALVATSLKSPPPLNKALRGNVIHVTFIRKDYKLMESIITKGLEPLMIFIWIIGIILTILFLFAPVFIYQIRNQLISVNKKLATLIKIFNSQASFNSKSEHPLVPKKGYWSRDP